MRQEDSKLHAAMHAPGHLLAPHATAGGAQDRAQPGQIAAAGHEATGETVERRFAWAARLRRLARDYQRLPQPRAGLHFVASVTRMPAEAAATFGLVRSTV